MPAFALLGQDEPAPVSIRRETGSSALLLVCDHAGRRIPARLGSLGLSEPDLLRHIAWDIGIAAVSRLVSDTLDATLVEQSYSRLVIDCNRPPDAPSSIPTTSEATPIPGNASLTAEDRQARREAIFAPYHAAIEALVESRRAAGRETALIAMHSFTPVYLGIARPWHIGTLYGRDARLAASLRNALAEEPGLVVGDNEPYSVSEGSDCTIPVHGERNALIHVGIEIRQDLISSPEGQAEWANRLSAALPRALARIAA